MIFSGEDVYFERYNLCTNAESLADPCKRASASRRSSSMAALDWPQCPAVESIPGKVSSAWVFKGTRTPVALGFGNLEDGVTIDELIDM